MLFVTSSDVIPGKIDEAVELVKSAKPPNTVKIRDFLQMFGKPDYLMIYEAEDEEHAMNFILYFCPAMIPKSAVAIPVEEMG